jgi:hypothetical protein
MGVEGDNAKDKEGLTAETGWTYTYVLNTMPVSTCGAWATYYYCYHRARPRQPSIGWAGLGASRGGGGKRARGGPRPRGEA